MSATQLISRSEHLGIMLRLDGDEIVYRCRHGVMTQELRDALKDAKPDIVSALSVPASLARSDGSDLCPVDIVERISVLKEDGLRRTKAETLALAEAGFTSWSGYVQHRASCIEQILDWLPKPSGDRATSLFNVTPSFIGSPWFLRTTIAGWSDVELFGIGPRASGSVGEWGLVTHLALSSHRGSRLKGVTRDQATIACASGSTLTYYRFRPAMDISVPWWDSPSLFGGASR
jgi:TubC N-terminal docking domain